MTHSVTVNYLFISPHFVTRLCTERHQLSKLSLFYLIEPGNCVFYQVCVCFACSLLLNNCLRKISSSPASGKLNDKCIFTFLTSELMMFTFTSSKSHTGFILAVFYCAYLRIRCFIKFVTDTFETSVCKLWTRTTGHDHHYQRQYKHFFYFYFF